MQQVLHEPLLTDNQVDRVTRRLIRRIGSHRYEMWFSAVRLSIHGHTVELSTDSQFVAGWIDSHFSADVAAAAADVLKTEVTVRVKVSAEAVASGSPGIEPAAPLPFPSANADDKQHDAPATAPRRRRQTSLRRLDAFVVGPSNKLAFSAARALTEEANARLVSPLFIHGECGVGKTHLLQGVCQRLIDQHGPTGVRYVTGEQFTNEYIASVRNGTIEAFRNRVRMLDTLAIDDVQFLSNKARTQSEFQYTLDAICHSGARIVMASNEHPRQIKKFSSGLVNRLLSGMVVQIDPPDRETRTKLIHKIAADRSLHLTDAAAEAIARRCVGSVRELEGAVTKVAALSMLRGDSAGDDPVGLVLVEQVFSDQSWRPAAPVRIGCIIDVVCARVGITRGDLLGSGRHHRVVLARALVAYLARDMTTLSYPEIAQAIGRRHHSTIHTAAQRLGRQMAVGDRISLATTEISVTDLVDQLRQEVLRS